MLIFCVEGDGREAVAATFELTLFDVFEFSCLDV